MIVAVAIVPNPFFFTMNYYLKQFGDELNKLDAQIQKQEKCFKWKKLEDGLTKLYDITRDHCADEMEAEVSTAWNNVDTIVEELQDETWIDNEASLKKLNNILQDAEGFITANRGLPYWKENPLADNLPFGFPVPVQGKKNMAMYEGMMGSWIDKLVHSFVCNNKEDAKRYVDQMLTMGKLMDHMAHDEEEKMIAEKVPEPWEEWRNREG